MNTTNQITVIGASAGVGLETVQAGLDKGLTVVAMARRYSQPFLTERLIEQQGDATVLADVKRAIAGSQAVLVTLGTGTSMKATTLYSQAAPVILQAIRESDQHPTLLVVTGFGTADTPRYQSWLTRLFMGLMLKDVYADKTRMEAIIAASDTNWIIARPGQLTDGPATGQYRALTRYGPGMHISSISRGDVAHFLIDQAMHPTLIHEYVSLSY